jgi:hypothetical protein
MKQLWRTVGMVERDEVESRDAVPCCKCLFFLTVGNEWLQQLVVTCYRFAVPSPRGEVEQRGGLDSGGCATGNSAPF